jgi:hypothetical protein
MKFFQAGGSRLQFNPASGQYHLEWALSAFGDVPTKVRKTPRDLAQTRIYTRTYGFLRLPKSDGFQAANFFGACDPDRILKLFVQEIVLAQQINMLPGHDPAVCDGLELDRPRFWPYELTDLLGKVEIVPEGDGIFDAALATLGHFLFLLFRLRKLHWISDGHVP